MTTSDEVRGPELARRLATFVGTVRPRTQSAVAWYDEAADALVRYAELLEAAEELLRLREAEHWPGVYGHDEFERLRKQVRP